jgi:queuosine precursor transporter
MNDRADSKPLAAGLPAAGITLVSLYVAAQIISDVASLKIAVLFGFSIDAGTFIYPATFTLRDLVHKRLGKRAARLVIVLAGAINLAMAGFFAFSAWLPGDPSWGLAVEFSRVLGPVWRIVIASIAAEVAAEMVDTEIYHLWVTRITRRHQWARVLVSNAVSVPLDSLIFCWAAFGAVLPASTVWSIFLANIIVKGVVTVLSIPGIYLVREQPGQS